MSFLRGTRENLFTFLNINTIFVISKFAFTKLFPRNWVPLSGDMKLYYVEFKVDNEVMAPGGKSSYRGNFGGKMKNILGKRASKAPVFLEELAKLGVV